MQKSFNADLIVSEAGQVQAQRPMPHRPGSQPGDWPEDFSHENGNYMCRCCHCEVMFYGHKRRVSCKVCSTGPLRNDAEQAAWLADKIGALGDYAKEAAAMLRRWPVSGGLQVQPVTRGLIARHRKACFDFATCEPKDHDKCGKELIAAAEALEAALPAAVDTAQPWRDIATAPKERLVPLLLWTPMRWGKLAPALPLCGYWMDTYWVIVNADAAVQRVEPTHWMPLPQPPVLAKETGTATGRNDGCEACAAISASNGSNEQTTRGGSIARGDESERSDTDAGVAPATSASAGTRNGGGSDGL